MTRLVSPAGIDLISGSLVAWLLAFELEVAFLGSLPALVLELDEQLRIVIELRWGLLRYCRLPLLVACPVAGSEQNFW